MQHMGIKIIKSANKYSLQHSSDGYDFVVCGTILLTVSQ
jgi:hypothetical protein